jgi:hypothetical protein
MDNGLALFALMYCVITISQTFIVCSMAAETRSLVKAIAKKLNVQGDTHTV